MGGGLPINSSKANKQGCAPVSSNCVIWSGPDLKCISLCKGDSISDVAYKIAVELCAVMTSLDISDYELGCLVADNSSTEPKDIKELIESMISHICALEESTGSSTTAASAGCPTDCLVDMAACFTYTNESGDLVTSTDLVSYIKLIGQKVCGLEEDVEANTQAISDINEQNNSTDELIEKITKEKAEKTELIVGLDRRVSTLGDVHLTKGLKEIERVIIEREDLIGSSSKLSSGMSKDSGIHGQTRLSTTGEMRTLPGWEEPAKDMSDSINNLWLVVKDIRTAVRQALANVDTYSCESLILNFRSRFINQSTKSVLINTDGSQGFTPGWSDNGSTVSFTDNNGGDTTETVDLITLMSNTAGQSINLSVLDLTGQVEIIVTSKFIHTSGTICERVHKSYISKDVVCSVVTSLTTASTTMTIVYSKSLDYSNDIEVSLLDGTIVKVISKGPSNSGGTEIITGLTALTDYRVKLTSYSGSSTKECHNVIIKTKA